ncbi:MAG: class I adenylate-forming enzyme family protein [Patescibacteria group bacterium]|nr:class I adenylate-forming enzyme family protein [Patescibacteria group bacterium]
MYTTVPDILLSNFNERSGRVAVIEAESGDKYTYSDIYSGSLAILGSIRAVGVGKNDRVGVFSQNSAAYVSALFGILMAGATAVPLNTLLPDDEISRMTLHCGLSAFLFQESQRERAGRITLPDGCARIALDDIKDPSTRPGTDTISETGTALIIYTSGTTRAPLGVMLSHRNICSNTASIMEYTGIGPDDIMCCVLPFHYIYGLSLLFSHFMAGASLVIDNRFLYPNVVLDSIEDHGVTGFAGVSSHYAILLSNSDIRDRCLPSLRYFLQAGDSMHPDITRQMLDIFPEKKIFIMYGQTEASPRLTYLDPAKVARKPFSVGNAVPGVEVRIVDGEGRECPPGQEGEIVARGPGIMQGYWNASEETAKVLRDGWLHTGDMGIRDEEGDISIVGRGKAFLKVGANRINPFAIEHAIAGQPGIASAAVVDVPDRILGSRLVLFVEKENGASISENDIIAICRAKLPKYMVSSDIMVIGSMPKNDNMKIDRNKLRGMI